MAETLSKFGIPIEGTNLGILQPKQSYRFRVIFKSFGSVTGTRELTQNIVTCERPSLATDEVEVHSYNSISYIPGKARWQPLEVTIRDDITNSVVTAIGSQLQKQQNHLEQTTAVAGSVLKFSMEVHSLDGTTGEELESFEIEGCWITNVSYPSGDYGNSEANVVTLTVRFDNAIHVAGPNTNGGTTVGGDIFENIDSPTGGTTTG